MSLAINNTIVCVHIPLSSYNWKLSLGDLQNPSCLNTHLPWNAAVYCIIAAVHGITYWLSVGLCIKIWITFNSWKTLYFWAITITAIGIILTTIALDLEFFTLFPVLIGGTINYVGWVCMVTGFALVLYSRLHLITSNLRALHYLLSIIVVTNLLVYVTTFVSGYLPNATVGAKIYKIAYRFEIVFAIQEVGLASFYTYLFIRFIRGGDSGNEHSTKKMLYLLYFAQVITFCCDVILISLVYTDMIVAKNTIQTFSYAIKLEVEFMVLNRLVWFGKSRQGRLQDYETHGICERGPDGQNSKSLEKGRLQEISVSGRFGKTGGASIGSQNNDVCMSDPREVPSSLLDQNGKNNQHDRSFDSIEEIERQYLGPQ